MLHPHLLQLLVLLRVHLLLHVLEPELREVNLSGGFTNVVCPWRNLPNYNIRSVTRRWFTLYY